MSQLDASINDILDIKDTIGDLVTDSDSDNKVSDEEKQFKERMKKIEQIKEDLKTKNTVDDEEFIKSSLKKIVNLGVVAAESLGMELEAHPDGRGTECLATVLNAATTAVKELNNVNTDKEKIKISRETLDVKRLGVSGNNSGGPRSVQNNFFGTPSDLLDMLKNEKSKEKTIEAEKIS